MKEDLQSVTECIIPTKLQSFLFVNQIEQNVHQCQQYIEDMEHDTRAKEVYFKIKKNYEIEKVICNLRSFNSLGEVMVVTTEGTNRETRMTREAQVESRKQTNINVIMNIKTKIEINMEKSISDMICLMDGRVIVVELQGNVNLLTSDGKLQKRLSKHGVAWCVTQINQNTIAITYPHEKSIKIFNLEKEKVTKTISILKLCYGLSFSDNYLAVGLYKDEIRIIDLEGKQLKSIQVESKSNLYNLVYCNDRVIYSDYMGKAVCCYDGSGKQIWQYKQDLGPWGLRTDTSGNIIVADFESTRIIVISKDGQNSKVLMSEEDRLTDPKCICFNHNEYSGFICDDNGRYLAKFNLSHR
ncbi:Hypothetical predicted protein [Mytilus galloprovincialis]|uniref:TRIM2_3 n=1 Tax=Mytilus galloprovincialis TaxID=29158 RepID=A0A8B6FDP8_MYTGA|nr:Hypothetical predicted protein [Mytilus galloprovincialis]